MTPQIIKESVLVLNKYFLAVQVSIVEDAIKALVKDVAKVVVEDYSTYDLKDWVQYTTDQSFNPEIVEKYAGLVRSPSIQMLAPHVIMFPDCLYTSPLIKTVRFSRRNVFQRDNHTCQYCGHKFKAKELNIDHVVPRSRGGPNSWKNLVTSCKPCNAKKGDDLLTEIGWKLLQEPTQPKWKSHVGKPFNMNKRIYWQNFLK